MRRSCRTVALPVVLVTTAWACGTRPFPGPPLGVGTLGSGGGTEILDGGETSGSGSGERSGSSGSSGGSGRGAGTGSSSAGSGAAGSTGAESGSSTSGNSSSGATEAPDAGDAGAGGVVLTIPSGPIHIVSLRWTISGPNTYQGSVEFGDAQSFEWVVGGILAARGYMLSVTATDAQGDPCKGTSSTFNVVPGMSTYTMITITCDVGSDDQADVTTGSVAIEAGVVAASD
jgi:hypothetical protein